MESPKLMVDYKGGDGPSQELAENNDKVLKYALNAIKIPSIWNNTFLQELCDVPEDIKVLEITRQDCEKIYVSYDRWGYVIDGLEDGDQVGIIECVKLIKDWYNV